MQVREVWQGWVRPTLREASQCIKRLGGIDAETLIMGTAAVESDFRWLHQRGGGPARSFWQVEPTTAQDIIERTRDLGRTKESYRELSFLMKDLQRGQHIRDALVLSPPLAILVARLKYWFDPKPIPSAYDAEAQALYWKRVYNTPLGKGATPQYYVKFNDMVKPVLRHFV